MTSWWIERHWIWILWFPLWGCRAGAAAWLHVPQLPRQVLHVDCSVPAAHAQTALPGFYRNYEYYEWGPSLHTCPQETLKPLFLQYFWFFLIKNSILWETGWVPMPLSSVKEARTKLWFSWHFSRIWTVRILSPAESFNHFLLISSVFPWLLLSLRDISPQSSKRYGGKFNTGEMNQS